MKITLLLLTVLSLPAFASNCAERRSALNTLWIDCPSQSKTLFKGTLDQRLVVWSVPSGTPPARGWPVVIISQGSFFPVEFSRPSNLPFGGFNEVRLIRELLDRGFAVMAPRGTVRLGWITNVPHGDYENRADYKVLAEVLRLIPTGAWGPLDQRNVFATGISSGGYHTSRLGLAFPGRFRALAIQSASYATCLGPLCRIPDSVPETHPPTLFLHGERDFTVPISTARRYFQLLVSQGIETSFITDPKAGHAWLDDAPEAIAGWFERFRR